MEKDEIPEERLSKLFQEAKKVIIAPGYGLAQAQAQQQLKKFMDVLEEKGKEVKAAIHPVAGRMPGHMNVLLAEVGVEHDKLFDMEEINPEFPDTDLVVIVGACDVVNPAAQDEEGTPLSGMPILQVSEAKNIVVCNLDDQPGYSGVENPLYGRDKVIPLWGDASETVPMLTEIVESLDSS